jgi:glycine/D-amino acid oxidase-like deaminating enzyme
VAGYDRVRDVVESYGIDCDWAEGGAVHGSIHRRRGNEEDEGTDKGEGGGLTPGQVDRIMGRPSDGDGDGGGLYKGGGGYDPNCGSVNPLRLTLGLADAVESWGVRIYENTKVVKLEKKEEIPREQPREEENEENEEGGGEGGGGGVVVVRDRGRYAVITDAGRAIRCDHVVLCTGAAPTPADVSRRLSRSFLPFYTYMAASEPLGEGCPLRDGAVENELRGGGGPGDGMDVGDFGDVGDGVRTAPPTYGDDHLILNYWRSGGGPSPNDGGSSSRVLFGSLGDTYPQPAWLVSLRLRNALSEVYPQLRDVRFDRIWGGKLAFSLNSLPLIGRDVDFDYDDDDRGDAGADGGENFTGGGVWYATAFAGHGIIPTAVAGSLVANAILGVPDHQQWRLFQSHFPPSSWNGYPFSRLGAGAVLSLYNAWDWLGKRGVPLPPLPDLW